MNLKEKFSFFHNSYFKQENLLLIKIEKICININMIERGTNVLKAVTLGIDLIKGPFHHASLTDGYHFQFSFCLICSLCMRAENDSQHSVVSVNDGW